MALGIINLLFGPLTTPVWTETGVDIVVVVPAGRAVLGEQNHRKLYPAVELGDPMFLSFYLFQARDANVARYSVVRLAGLEQDRRRWCVGQLDGPVEGRPQGIARVVMPQEFGPEMLVGPVSVFIRYSSLQLTLFKTPS